MQLADLCVFNFPLGRPRPKLKKIHEVLIIVNSELTARVLFEANICENVLRPQT